MDDCLFCKIIAGEIPSKKVYEDDRVYAFYDIDPQAPIHFLVIPKQHITGANKIDATNGDLVGHAFQVIAQITKELGCGDDWRDGSWAGLRADGDLFSNRRALGIPLRPLSHLSKAGEGTI